jgi:hypothetical protein
MADFLYLCACSVSPPALLRSPRRVSSPRTAAASSAGGRLELSAVVAVIASFAEPQPSFLCAVAAPPQERGHFGNGGCTGFFEC